MNFFEELAAKTKGCKKISFTITQKDGKLTIGFLPEVGHADVDDNIQMLNLTGTPEEMDEGFFNAIAAPVERAVGLKTNIGKVTESLDTAQKEIEEGATKSKAANKKHAAKAKPSKRSEVKVGKEKQEEPEAVGEQQAALEL